MSVMQTLWLRTNVEVSDPTFKKQKATGFGSNYSNKNLNIWHCIVTVEQDESHSVDMMETDFDMVPIVHNLNENANLGDALFCTSDSKKCNILFKILTKDDKYSI